MENPNKKMLQIINLMKGSHSVCSEMVILFKDMNPITNTLLCCMHKFVIFIGSHLALGRLDRQNYFCALLNRKTVDLQISPKHTKS